MVGLFGSLFGNYDDNDNDNHSDDKKRKDEGRLTLHKEELDINKTAFTRVKLN